MGWTQWTTLVSKVLICFGQVLRLLALKSHFVLSFGRKLPSYLLFQDTPYPLLSFNSLLFVCVLVFHYYNNFSAITSSYKSILEAFQPPETEKHLFFSATYRLYRKKEPVKCCGCTLELLRAVRKVNFTSKFYQGHHKSCHFPLLFG